MRRYTKADKIQAKRKHHGQFSYSSIFEQCGKNLISFKISIRAFFFMWRFNGEWNLFLLKTSIHSFAISYHFVKMLSYLGIGLFILLRSPIMYCTPLISCRTRPGLQRVRIPALLQLHLQFIVFWHNWVPFPVLTAQKRNINKYVLQI